MVSPSLIAHLIGYLLLLLSGKVDEVVVFGANQKRNSSFVESSPLPVPFFNRIECALSCQIEHEQYGNSIVAHQWQHVDKLPLTAKIPDRESYLGVSDRDSLLHEIDTYFP